MTPRIKGEEHRPAAWTLLEQRALWPRGDVSQLRQPVGVRRLHARARARLLVRHVHVHLVDRWHCWLRLLLDLLQVRKVIWEEEERRSHSA